MVNPMDAVAGLVESVLPATPTAAAAAGAPPAMQQQFMPDKQLFECQRLTAKQRCPGSSHMPYTFPDCLSAISSCLWHQQWRALIIYAFAYVFSFCYMSKSAGSVLVTVRITVRLVVYRVHNVSSVYRQRPQPHLHGGHPAHDHAQHVYRGQQVRTPGPSCVDPKFEQCITAAAVRYTAVVIWKKAASKRGPPRASQYCAALVPSSPNFPLILACFRADCFPGAGQATASNSAYSTCNALCR
jgi:hypothetical protein